MRRHVIRPFQQMRQIAHLRRIRRRHQPREIGQEVALHVWIGVLLDQQRGRGVPHKERQQPIPLPGKPSGHIIGEFVERLPARFDGKYSLHLSRLPNFARRHPSIGPQPVSHR